MFTKRIIPCLDVHAGRVVKGVNFVDLKDAGDPVEIARAYDTAGADELIVSSSIQTSPSAIFPPSSIVKIRTLYILVFILVFSPVYL